MQNKKVLFLAMLCRQDLFYQEFEAEKQTWAKDIVSGYYGENVMFLGYDGWDKETYFDEEKLILHVKSEDDTNHTYKKTYLALKYLQEKYDFDFIFRTNTSTYVNVPYLLRLINTLDSNTEVLWAGEIYSLANAFTPFPLTLYARGNTLLMSKRVIEIFLTHGINFLYGEKIDDEGIGNILNSYHISRGEDYQKFLNCFQFGWYKSVDSMKYMNNHPLSDYWNADKNFETLCIFLAIQVKKYDDDRYTEIDSLHELDRIYRENDYVKVYENLNDKCVETIYNYTYNYPVFLGPFIGYTNISLFNLFDKDKLYLYQINALPENEEYTKLKIELTEQYKYLI